MSENCIATPLKKGLREKLIIPPSPFLKKLGFGTGVCVYEFTRSPINNKTRSPWAIKKIHKKPKDNELKKRLNFEAEILRELKHPNIVGFRAYLKDPKGDILALEECTTSLGDLIEDMRDNDDETPFPVKVIYKVGQDVSSALNYLHNTALILHCDVKSFNILIKNDFEICKLCDFGVCLPLKKDGTVDETKADEEFEYIGTYVWSAPEVLKCPQIITTKADVYSFGIVLYEMLTLSIPPNKLPSDTSEENLDNSLFEDDQLCLPDIDISEEYNLTLEIMYRCVLVEYKERPSFRNLENVFKESLRLLSE